MVGHEELGVWDPNLSEASPGLPLVATEVLQSMRVISEQTVVRVTEARTGSAGALDDIRLSPGEGDPVGRPVGQTCPS
jgi:hypothetical protein